MHQPRTSAFAISGAAHVVAIGVLMALTGGRDTHRRALEQAHIDAPLMVWLPVPGPGGGGGGGGNRNPEPARAAELRGTDKMTMPVAPGQTADAAEKPEPRPTQLADVPARTFGASDLTAMGLIEAGADSLSQGPGRDNGAGTGRGPGIGPGDGPGLGPGRDGNTGGDVYRPGSGVTMPVALHRERPQYTVAAMRARIQGEVMVECVVEATGECSRFRVVRSLDPRLGLDEEALRAAARWRFTPGMRQGKAVPVLVTILVGFSIH